MKLAEKDIQATPTACPVHVASKVGCCACDIVAGIERAGWVAKYDVWRKAYPNARW